MTTQTLSPSPWLQFTDNNGVPLAGGKLFTYAAGTTTKLATYSDSVGTPNTNPVILDATGRANIWLTPNVAYKYVLSASTDTDPPTASIRTVDQIVNAQLLTLYGGVDTGAINAYVLTFTAQFTSYSDGIAIYWIPSHTNTSASTVNVNGIGVTAILNPDGSALTAGQIIQNQVMFILCRGGQFYLSTVFGTSGLVNVAGINVTGSGIPTNGVYLPGFNTVGFATNGILRGYVNNAGNWIFGPPSSGATATFYESLNSINAQKLVATYEAGTFTGTLTGCTTSPTAQFNWTRAANTITVDFSAGISATSNTNAMTITGAPAGIAPVRAQLVLCRIIDNGTTQLGCVVMNAGSSILTFSVGATAAVFTTSGTKGLTGGLSFTYSLT